MVANILPGAKRSKFNFSEHGHVAYQIKVNHECSNMVANILPGAKRSKFNFSEHGHVAYQIKVNHECSDMVANSLPVYPPPFPTLRWGQKVKMHFFQEMVMLHVKLKGLTNAATW